MRAVVQRVSHANVVVNNEVSGEIKNGFLVLLGIEEQDNEKDLDYIVEKIVHLRIFEDKQGKMNLSLLDVKGELLVVSQFTLLGDCRRGRRPSFTDAAKPEKADVLYKKFIEKCKTYEIKVETGVFQADMEVNLCNKGPVTMLIDSQKKF
jgi:D-tyrosyl-tRNA(Tyr) deacylase